MAGGSNQDTNNDGLETLVNPLPQRKPRIIESRTLTSEEAETIKHVIKVKGKKRFKPIIEDDDEAYIADSVTDSTSASENTKQTRKTVRTDFLKNKGETKAKILIKRQSMEVITTSKKNLKTKRTNSRKETDKMDTETSSEEEVFNPLQAPNIDLIKKFKEEVANITLVRTRSGHIQGKFMGLLKRTETNLLELFHEMADRVTRSIGGGSYLKTENRAHKIKIRALEAENQRLKDELTSFCTPARKG